MITVRESLVHNTIRLSCRNAAGGLSFGTGFFFSFSGGPGEGIPVIVTNKHVIAGAVEGQFRLTIADKDFNPIVGQTERITIPDFEAQWLKHPDPNVDLAVLLVGNLLNWRESEGVFLHTPCFDETWIPTSDTFQTFSYYEEVLMIGYPSAMYDNTNNLPIVRRGITATHPRHPYLGMPWFVTDCAAFGGSSGSPVLTNPHGLHTDFNGTTVFTEHRKFLVGILFAHYYHTVEGKLVFQPAPAQLVPTPETNVPNHLGLCVRSDKLLDFKESVQGMVALSSTNIQFYVGGISYTDS